MSFNITSFVKKGFIVSLILSLIFGTLGSLESVFAQNLGVTSLPVTVINTVSPLTNAQCNDGVVGHLALHQVRLYNHSNPALSDVHFPYDTVITAPSANPWVWLYDLNMSTVKLNNLNNNSLQSLGNFVVKSRGSPSAGSSVIRGRVDAGIKAVGHPISPLSVSSQLVYNLKRVAYRLNPPAGWPGIYNTPITSFPYLANIGGSSQNTPAYTSTYTNPANATYNRQGDECTNYYVSRCGDGYIDSPSSNNHAVPLANGTNANEQCDPGANLASAADDIMPAGAPAGASCSATCTINAPTPPSLTIDKQQRLLPSNTFQGVGLGTPSDIPYTSPGQFEFRIIITNNGGNATNVVMRDTLPVGFVMDALPGGCAGTIDTLPSTSVACNAQAGTTLTSQSFNLPAGKKATFLVKGTLTSVSPTTNSVYASYTNPINNTSLNTLTDTVNQHPQLPSTTLAITKQQRNVTTNTPAGVTNYTSADINFAANDDVEFKITVATTSPGTATNVMLNDTLPVGFVISPSADAVKVDNVNTPVTINGLNAFSLALGTMVHSQTKTIIVKGKMTNASNTTAQYYKNTASVTYTTNGTTTTAGPVVVYQNPIGVPSLTIDKQQRLYPSGTFEGVGLYTPSTISYTSPAQFEFKIIITNTGTATANNVIMNDTLPSGFTVSSCSGLVAGATSVSCNAQAGTSLTSASFTLPAGQAAVFTVIGTLTGNSLTVNQVNATYTNPSNPGVTITTPTDSVNQTPIIIPPVLALTKEVKNVTLSGQFYQADTAAAAVPVSGSHQIQYKLTVTHSGGPVIQPVRISDTFPTSGVIINFMTVAGTSLANPTSNPFDIIIPASAFASASSVEVLINATVSATAASTTYVNQSLLYYGDSGLPIDNGIDNNAWINIGPKPAPNLTIEKTILDGSGNFVDGATINQGQAFQMRLRVMNIGNASATGVFVRDICPAGLTCSSYIYNGQTTAIVNNTVLTTNIAPANGLLPGAYVDVIINAMAIVSNTTITNVACVDNNDAFSTIGSSNPVTATLPGFTSPCNAATIQVPVLQPPRVVVTKTANKSQVSTIGEVVRYTITVKNVSTSVAKNVILKDTFPFDKLDYYGNFVMTPSSLKDSTFTTLPTTLNGTFPDINLGTLNPNDTVEIKFDAKIKVLPTDSMSIKNLVSVSCVGVDGQACTGNPPTGECTKDDLTYNGATGECHEIKNPPLSRCGDGRVSRFEQCDMAPCNGTGSVNGGAGIIGSYMDSCNTTSSNALYNGKTCNARCEIEGVAKPTMPACWYTDTVISVMKDEVLPVATDIEVKDSDLVDICNTANANKLRRGSLMCKYMLFNKDEETTNGSSLLRELPCDTKEWTVDGNKLYEGFKSDPLFAWKDHTPYGSFLVDMTSSLINNGYGEYKVSLEDVNYEYCDGSTWRKGSPYARVCQINIAVTRPYLMQKSNTVYKPNDTLDNFFTLGKGYTTLVKATQFDSLSERTQLSNLEYKGKVKTLTEDLLKKYEKLAIAVDASGLGALGTVKKVPGKAIYIMDSAGGLVLEGNKLGTTPTTLIAKGNGTLTIRGSVGANMLILVPNGKVKFDTDLNGSDQYSSDDHRCGPQVIRGIIIANSFVASNTDLRNTRSNVNDHTRCRKGNLHVYGALYGNNIDDLVASRRSHLEHRFTYNTNFGIGSAPSDSAKNAERRDEIYKGASVYIEQNPSLWRDMPPGAAEFLKSFNVSRY